MKSQKYAPNASTKTDTQATPANQFDNPGNAQAIAQATQEAKQFLKQPPTRAEVLSWLKHDIQTAIYSLSAVSQFPELLEKMANEMYEHAQKTPDQIMAEQAAAKAHLSQEMEAELANKTNYHGRR